MEQLKDEATKLGLDFKGIKSKAALQELLDTYYESQAADDLVEEKQEEETVEEKKDNTQAPAQIRAKGVRAMVAQLKKEALKTKIVRITNNDKRDNHVTTTCYLSCENQYWGISKIVPLDEPVELEQCLIDTAKAIEVVLHVDEIIEGKRTGNKVPKLVKKYVISYEEIN